MSSSTPGVDVRTATTDYDDELMSEQHKELLSAHRIRLVANMFPDDVLNRLQSRKVLNARDVTRIKDKTPIDGQVELLLDTLMRKPDRAFSELISALVDCDQKHIAKLLSGGDKNATAPMQSPAVVDNRYGERSYDNGRRSSDDDDGEYRDRFEGRGGERRRVDGSGRKRKAETVRVSVSASDVELEDDSDVKRRPRHSSAAAADAREKQLVAQLNVELLETTLMEVRNLRKVVASGHEPRSLVRRKTLLQTIELLTKYRREITDISDGSVVFCVRCDCVRALNDLRVSCSSGRLRDALRADFVTADLLAKYRLRSFDFAVTFSEAEYQLCRNELAAGRVQPPLSALQPCADSCFESTLPFLKVYFLLITSTKEYDDVLQSKLTPPIANSRTADKTAVSPDSGISSLPSPVSLPDTCLAAGDSMVLRSHRRAAPVTGQRPSDDSI